MGKLTSFYDRESGQSGPIDGSIQIIAMPLETALATNTTAIRRVDFPAGMSFEITDISLYCGTVTEAATGVTPPQVSVGTTAAGTQIVAAASLVTGANVLEIKDGTVDAGGFIDLRVVSATNSAAALPLGVNITGFVTAAPSSIPER